VPKKVLVADDEEYILDAIVEIIKQENFVTLTAANGAEALKLARTEVPDLLLLDIMMPEKSGFEVCRELKSDPATKGIYIILLTAMGQQRDEERGYESGADEYMTKPFSPRDLKNKLRELLG